MSLNVRGTVPVEAGLLALSDSGEDMVDFFLLEAVVNYAKLNSFNPVDCGVHVEHNDRHAFRNGEVVRAAFYSYTETKPMHANIKFSEALGTVTVDYIDPFEPAS
ncbi:hypothetical protein HYV12_01275 [Candidatus Dojkabacteria bacterium]|nr:hypothetical protein [Candidatus Dojkabacteria bacterium]